MSSLQQIVLATSNAGKVREFNRMLENTGIEVVLQSKFNVQSPAETGTTFIENAIIKARAAALATNLPAIADDSGICVDGLQGAPGVYSARYSGEHATDESNLCKLIEAVKDLPEKERSAHYHCVLVLMRHGQDPAPIVCQASWHGTIICDRRGTNGFGYDPIFYVPLLGKTAAELEPEVKNRISHRGQAMTDLLPILLQLYAQQPTL